MSVTVAGITFDHVSYDAEADVLYLHVGDPSEAVDFDASPEGHALRFDGDGQLVGLTLVGARRLLAGESAPTVTLPSRVNLPREQLVAALG